MGITLIENPQEIFIPCHKNFIMDRSEFFKVIINCQFEEGNKFREQEARKELPIIELYQSLPKETLTLILNFIYCEKIELNKGNFVEFLTLGELFGIPSLVKQCDDFLFKSRFNGEEIFELYKYALNCDSESWILHLERNALEHVKRESFKRKNPWNLEQVVDDLLKMGANPKSIAKYIGV